MTDSADLDAWASELSEALGIGELVVPVSVVLDLARDAAHSVARPAAPLTTFLVGFAAARRGGTAADIAAAAAIASQLALRRLP
ncbi:DUF6457 domain-containing protein [Glaciibacter sp. 2TAF33]|uniref:DUF6457 domain-containing protein n=1 Tax=Glaciibacter sp. 2TAF33 TaxID=3233015 RepID=UPI003F926C6E